MDILTSRERLLRVLKGEMPDRVPVSTYELIGHDSTNFCNKEPSYKNLMEYIREKTDCVCMWELKSDERLVASAFDPGMEAERTELPDGYETRYTLRACNARLQSRARIIDGVYTVWHTEHWCKTLEDVDAIMSLPYTPVSYDASDLERIHSELSDRGILMSSLADPGLIAMELMEFGDAMVWAMTEPGHFASVIERIHERVMTNLERALDAHTADLYRICGPEYMTPPYLPPNYFERFVVPYVTDMVDLIHKKGGRARVHCHGKIGQVLDMIARTGADALDPCEGPPDGDIELPDVKLRVGGQMTLFGNIQLKMLENGTEEGVRREVKRIMDAAKAGGRLVIMPTAAPINVPLSPRTEALYRAYIDAALEYGAY